MSGMMPRAAIGLIPAAGLANRIAPLPCSKELYPVGFRIDETGNAKRPKVVSHYLLEKMRLAGVSRIYFILRTGKWDIPGYYGDGSMLNVPVAYLSLGSTWGVPFTLDHAYPFVRHSTIAFGFPDILFRSNDAFEKLMDLQSKDEAEAVLGLFGRKCDPKYDAVDVDDDGRVKNVIIGSSSQVAGYSWAIATWSPVFTEFLHTYVEDQRRLAARGSELSVGHVIKASVEAGLRVQSIVISEDPYLDIGTPDDLELAMQLGVSGQL